MVFPPINNKRKLSALNEVNNKQNTRRPISTQSIDSSTNRTTKLKPINDLNNKSLKTTKIEDSPAHKSKMHKLNTENHFKLNRTDLTNGLNKKSVVNKQTDTTKQSNQQQMSFTPIYHNIEFNFETEIFQKNENLYEQRIKSLKKQLDKLKQFEQMAKENTLNITTIHNEINEYKDESGFNYLSKFLSEINQIEKESTENISIVNNWYEKQKAEVEQQYNIESKRAVQEFQDKRRELKDNLKNDNEDKRRQIENDKNIIDINMDNTDPKPQTTRKLRRRFNVPISNLVSGPSANFDYSMDSNSFDIDSAHHLIGNNSNSIMNSSTVLLQGGVVTAAGLSIINSTNSIVASALASNVNSSCLNVSSVNNYFANSILNNFVSNNNDRNLKRKLGPAAITFTISEDEINEDLKCLS